MHYMNGPWASPVWGYSTAVSFGDWQTPSDYSCIKCCPYAARGLAASLFHQFSPLPFSRFQPLWHIHTHLSMWVMSDNLWSVPQVVQSQTKTNQFRTNVCLSSSTLISFPHWIPDSFSSFTRNCLSILPLPYMLSINIVSTWFNSCQAVLLLQSPSHSPVFSSTPHFFHQSFLLCVCLWNAESFYTSS